MVRPIGGLRQFGMDVFAATAVGVCEITLLNICSPFCDQLF